MTEGRKLFLGAVKRLPRLRVSAKHKPSDHRWLQPVIGDHLSADGRFVTGFLAHLTSQIRNMSPLISFLGGDVAGRAGCLGRGQHLNNQPEASERQEAAARQALPRGCYQRMATS